MCTGYLYYSLIVLLICVRSVVILPVSFMILVTCISSLSCFISLTRFASFLSSFLKNQPFVSLLLSIALLFSRLLISAFIFWLFLTLLCQGKGMGHSLFTARKRSQSIFHLAKCPLLTRELGPLSSLQMGRNGIVSTDTARVRALLLDRRDGNPGSLFCFL